MTVAEDLRPVIAALAAAWPSQFNQREQAELYTSSFLTNDPEDVAEAVRRLILTEEFLPTVAKIREVIRAIKRDNHPVLPAPELPEQEMTDAEYWRWLFRGELPDAAKD